MKLINASFLIAVTASVSAPLALATESLRGGGLLIRVEQKEGNGEHGGGNHPPELKSVLGAVEVGMNCASSSECTSGYCTENNSGQQGICVSVQEVEEKAIEPEAWSARLNKIKMAGCHNCYAREYAVGFATYRSVVQRIPALELDIRKCDDGWVVAHDACSEEAVFHRPFAHYLSDIKKTLEQDRYQFPIMVNLDFKDFEINGQGGDGEEINAILFSQLGSHVFTKNDLAAYNGLAVDTNFANPSWDRFRDLAATKENFWPKITEPALRNKVIFVANHIFNFQLKDVREFNNFHLAPSFVKDSNVDGGISTVRSLPDFGAEGQVVFGNLGQNGNPLYFPYGNGDKCTGDLPEKMYNARIVSRCWDGDNPDTLTIPTQWKNGVSVGTHHDVEGNDPDPQKRGMSLRYKIEAYASAPGQPGSSCNTNGDCNNSRCVYDLCRAGISGDPCEWDTDCDGLCGEGECHNGETGKGCGSDDDCANRRCVHDICRAGNNGDPCEKDSDCNNSRCVYDFCRAGISGDRCEWDTDCDGLCGEGECHNGETGETGKGCGSDDDCANRRCVHDICRAGNNGDPCEKDSDCNSGDCECGWLGCFRSGNCASRATEAW